MIIPYYLKLNWLEMRENYLTPFTIVIAQAIFYKFQNVLYELLNLVRFVHFSFIDYSFNISKI